MNSRACSAFCARPVARRSIRFRRSTMPGKLPVPRWSRFARPRHRRPFAICRAAGRGRSDLVRCVPRKPISTAQAGDFIAAVVDRRCGRVVELWPPVRQAPEVIPYAIQATNLASEHVRERIARAIDAGDDDEIIAAVEQAQSCWSSPYHRPRGAPTGERCISPTCARD